MCEQQALELPMTRTIFKKYIISSRSTLLLHPNSIMFTSPPKGRVINYRSTGVYTARDRFWFLWFLNGNTMFSRHHTSRLSFTSRVRRSLMISFLLFIGLHNTYISTIYVYCSRKERVLAHASVVKTVTSLR